MEEENKKLFSNSFEVEGSEFDEVETSEEEELIEAPTTLGQEKELDIGDFNQYEFVKNPEVGESVILEISKIVKKPGRKLKNKTDNSEFWTGLKGKDKKDEEREETIIETIDGKRFSINSWGLYFNLFGNESKLVQRAKTNKTFKGLKVKITHVFNGRDSKATVGDLMKLRGFKTKEEAEEHKKVVAKAIKEGTVYKVEVLN
jgi:hypothetical protein